MIPKVKPTPSGKAITVAEIVQSYKKSKENFTSYQDKEITVTGWGHFIKQYDFIHLYGNEKQSGVDFITCKINPYDWRILLK